MKKMNSRFKKSVIVFVIGVIVVGNIFLFLPINIFDGEIIYQQGLVSIKEQRPLSLYFVSGLEFKNEDLIGLKNYYLLPKGIITAFLLIICLPLLIAYRYFLGKKEKN